MDRSNEVAKKFFNYGMQDAKIDIRNGFPKKWDENGIRLVATTPNGAFDLGEVHFNSDYIRGYNEAFKSF